MASNAARRDGYEHATEDLTETIIGRMLEPRSVAVVGASSNASKRGHQILRSLVEDFRYAVYAVNPRGGHMLGRAVLPSVLDLPFGVDLAVVATPSQSVPSVVRDCARMGIAGVVILANGFETNYTEASGLQTALYEVVRETGIRLVGPNTSGMMNRQLGLNVVGIPHSMPAGPVSLVAQSGNMLLTLIADSVVHNAPGLDIFVGLGNQIDLAHADLVREIGRRRTTRVVLLHSEGMKDGMDFLTAAFETTRRVPLVLLHGGRTDAGRRAALSHTGSLGSTEKLVKGLMRQAGVTVVDRSDELVPVGAVLATSPLPRSGGVAVLADGGGHATLLADSLDTLNVPVAELSNATQNELKELLGNGAAVSNPVDVASDFDASPSTFARAAEVLAQDENVGLIIMAGLFGGYHLRFDADLREAEDTAAAEIIRLAKRHGCPVVVHSVYAHVNPPSHGVLRKGGVPVLSSIEHVARAVEALYRRKAWLQMEPVNRISGAHRAASQPGSQRFLLEVDARKLLEDSNIGLGMWRFASSDADVVKAIVELGGRCAVKAVHHHVTHKSDVGGVILNVRQESAMSACRAIRQSLADHGIAAQPAGYIVTPMVDGGHEILLGAHYDAIWGPVVAFGSGGVLTNSIMDVSFRSASLDPANAREMISETTIGSRLRGFRNMPVVDLDGPASVLLSLGHLIRTRPDIRSIDLNPVIANDTGLHFVDVRVEVEEATRR